MYKLLIVDDEPLVQAGISSMLNWNELGIEICGTAVNGQIALQMIEQSVPDIVITDIKMPIMSGLELTRICYDRYGSDHPSFIILTSYEDFQMVKEALTYHVADYLVKIELTPESLSAAIKKVLQMRAKRQAYMNKDSRSDSSPFSNIHLYNDKFFIRLLNNLFEDKEQFTLQSKDLHLNFEYSAYICCHGEIISDTADAMSIEKQVSLFGSTMQMLKEITGKYLPCYSLALDVKHFAIVFCYNETPSDEYEKELLGILQNVCRTIHNYYNVDFYIGLGTPVNSPFYIYESYQYARQAFTYACEENPICFFNDCLQSDLSHSSFHMALFKEDLTKAFEEFDADILYRTIDKITDLFYAHPNHLLQAMDAVCNILYLSLSLLPGGEMVISAIFSDYPENYRSIYRQTTMEQIMDWLLFFRDSLCVVFLDRKKDYKNHIVTGVKHHIQEHLCDRLTLNEVAAVFGISPNYLSQLFKKYSDFGFNEYVNTEKIKEAKRLLAEGHYKVYELADMLGFESPFYFSKVFKKVEGCSPSEYFRGEG